MMKTTGSMFLTVITAASLATAMGCEQETQQSQQTQQTTVREDDARGQSGDSLRVTVDELHQQAAAEFEDKDAYVGSAERFLSSVGRKVDEWSALASDAASDAGGQVKTETQEAMRRLKDQKQLLSQKIEELKEESGAAWTEVKPELQSAMDELKSAYDKLAARFKDEQRAEQSQESPE